VEWPGLRACSERETLALIDYLASTAVPGYAADLARGALRAWHVTLGRDRLGETLSIFRDLGGVIAQTTTGQPRFRVNEIDEILHRSDCADARSRTSLEWLLARRRDGGFRDWRIVLLDSTLGTMVVDGNKRAAAIYRTVDANARTPAFLLGGPSSDRIPPPP
jgi:hypothetical protein